MPLYPVKMKIFLILSGLTRGSYRAIGTMIAVCLVHGGVGPHVFSERLLCQLVGRPTPAVDLSEVDDDELRAALQKASYIYF